MTSTLLLDMVGSRGRGNTSAIGVVSCHPKNVGSSFLLQVVAGEIVDSTETVGWHASPGLSERGRLKPGKIASAQDP